ncbi:hypothetical protein AYK20_02725 [Thermoplasmatales archaeon SG8-52-1]|nr:MAG: hypothetical protein AYK20_02725 [Thermoplasmatales archaeon SG8-52-1]
MSIKKELLDELTENQLKNLAETKGIQFKLNKVQKMYYADWDEKDKMVDILGDKESLTIKEIEEYIKLQNK